MSERSEREEAELRYGPQIDDLHEEELKREMRAEGRTTPKPKPTGNVCSSCVPWPLHVPTPSGRIEKIWHHQTDCADHPGERIRIARASVQGRSWPPSRWRR